MELFIHLFAVFAWMQWPWFVAGVLSTLAVIYGPRIIRAVAFLAWMASVRGFWR